MFSFMGITVYLKVEGEEEPPIDERTDGKPLADVVAGWVWFPDVVKVLGLSPISEKALQKVDYSAYGEEKAGPMDVWQDPKQLKPSLEELLAVYSRIKANPSILRQVGDVSKDTVAMDFFGEDRFEAADVGIEDAIKICDWAAQRGRRVAFVAL